MKSLNVCVTIQDLVYGALHDVYGIGLFAYIKNEKVRWPFASVTYVPLKNSILQLNTWLPQYDFTSCSCLFAVSITNYKHLFYAQANSYLTSFHVFEHLNNLTNKGDIPIWENLPYVSAHTLVINICIRADVR